tara:strand:+ start:103 stop:309 length:207 start_codon:yes stop_codon:yes gene_type:complete
MKQIFTLFLLFSFFKGCSSNEIFVYEKIPENIECHRFKKFEDIENCDRKKRIILGKNISNVIQRINSH